MRHVTRILSALVIMALLGSLVAGCGQSSKPAEQPKSEAPKAEPVQITVWSHLTDPEIAEVKKVAEEWAAKTNNKVIVVASQGSFQDFATAAQSGKAPDIMFGLPHDNLGTFYKAGLLAEVPAGFIKSDDYVKMSLDAVSYDGKMYAVPIAMESYALFYNTNKVKAPPADFKSFIEAAKKDGFAYDINNFYFSYAFISGYGGYVFKNTGGKLDPNDIGLANDGAKKGLKLLYDFVNTYKFMPKDINGDIAKGKFQTGKTAFYISGPWDVKGFQDAKAPFAVAPLPTLENGEKPSPFVGVQAAFVNAKSKNAKVAWDLLKYLVEKTPLPLFKTGNRIPVLKAALELPEVKGNAIMSAFAQSAANGTPMPNIPAMQAVWGPAGSALNLITSGKQPIDKAATEMVKQIQQGIATQK